jgi:hypothetical protein
MNSPPVPAAPGRRLRRAGVLAMVLGALCAVVAAVPIVPAFFGTVLDDLSSPVYTAPFDASVTLKAGTYQLLESEDGSALVGPGEVRVVDPTGTGLTSVRRSSGSYRIARGSEQFVDVVQFTASRAGNYQIYVAFPPNARMIIGRDPGDAFGRVAGWFVFGGIGLLVTVLGFVVLLIGLSRKPRPILGYYGQPAPQQLPPPGWYPDPGRPTAWRYWDGYRWQP